MESPLCLRAPTFN